jgi:hypothetical protein
MLQMTLPVLGLDPGTTSAWSAEQVLALFAERAPEGPRMGVKPLRLQQGPEPRTLVAALPESYAVALTSLDGARPAQLAYQLAHELFHVYSDPRCEHPLTELLACAVSLAALDLLAAQLACAAAPLRRHAARLIEYGRQVESEARAAAQLPSMDPERQLWARTFAMGCDERATQLAAAAIVKPLLAQHARWTAFLLAPAAVLVSHAHLGDAPCRSVPGEDWRATVSRQRWIAQVRISPLCAPEDEHLVASICDTFAIR